MVPSARNFVSAASATVVRTRLIAAARPNTDFMFLIAQLQARTLFNTSAMQSLTRCPPSRLHLGWAKRARTIIPDSEFHRRRVSRAKVRQVLGQHRACDRQAVLASRR